MEWRVEFSPGAEADLANILAYIEGDFDRIAAEQWFRKFLVRVRSLRNFPLRGSILEELKKEGAIRQVVHGKYRILYNCEEPVVQVLAIIRGATKFKTRLGTTRE